MNAPGSLVRLASTLIRPPAGHRHLFAYDRLLDVDVLREIGLDPHFVTLARYESRRWIINTGGHPTIVPRRGHQVLGVIWCVHEVELAALDILEGVPHHRERFGSFARTPEGRLCVSEFYASRDHVPGTAAASTLQPIIASVLKWGFRKDYIEELAAWESEPTEASAEGER